MPGDAFKKVLVGQPFKFPAEFYNALVDTVGSAKQENDTSTAGNTLVRSTTIVRVKNASGQDRGRFEILGIDEPIISPYANLQQFKNEVALTGVTPELPEHLGQFVILLEPIPAGQSGRAFISGVCPVRLASGGEPTDKFAEVRDGAADSLQPCPQGSAQILWRDSSSNWAVVRLGNHIPHPYALVDCKNQKPTLIVVNELANNIDRVVKVGDSCYRVRLATCDELRCYEPKCVTIAARYSDCSKCQSCWELARCDDTEVTKLTNTDLAAYEDRVVKLDDGYCYTVTQADNCYNAEPVTVIADYSDCTPCGHCYTLTACYDEYETLKVTNDLAEMTGKTSEELVTEGTVFEIDGRCYYVTAYDTDCYEAESREIANNYTECEQCGCFTLTECDTDPPEVLHVHAAENTTGDPLDLHDYVGQVLRLNDGKIYTVAHGTECEDAISVVVQEAYDDCESAQCYELTDCETSATLLTYADLAAYEPDTVLKRGDDDRCYTLVGATAWSASAEPFEVVAEYPNCTTCLEQIKYRLTPACAHDGCDEGGGGSLPEIITTEDLHAAVGQYVKVEGQCYQVAETETGDVSDETLDYQGPFAACTDCQSEPVSTRKARITRVYIEGDQIKADVEYDVISNGLIVGFCSSESQVVGDYCCDEGSSSGHPPV